MRSWAEIDIKRKNFEGDSIELTIVVVADIHDERCLHGAGLTVDSEVEIESVALGCGEYAEFDLPFSLTAAENTEAETALIAEFESLEDECPE